MNPSDETKAFYLAVYSVVSQVPPSHVTSYGHVAYLIGRPQNSRQVGSSLKHSKMIIDLLNKELPIEDQISFAELPWWRIVLSVGKISPRGNSSGEMDQARLLRAEGVLVLSNHHINMEDFGWFPDPDEITL